MDRNGNNVAKTFNLKVVEGKFGKAAYLNGNDSYIQIPMNLQGWKGLTISIWVKPEKKEGGDLSVIVDNGHDAKNNFAIQSADPTGEHWVWHCNGADLFFDLALNKWRRIMVRADTESGMITVSVNDKKSGEAKIEGKFEFGATPLTIGKLAMGNERYL